MDRHEEAQRSWEKLLNPEIMRGNLIAASIFLATYEVLRSSIIDQIRSFYSNEFRDGKWITSEEYQKRCGALDKSELRASLLWLQQMSVINDADIAQVDRIRQHRNQLAHELPKILSSAQAEVEVELLGAIHELVTKIDRWWIREVEIGTSLSPERHEVSDSEITSGNMLFIMLMLRTVTGEDSKDLWTEFQKHLREIQR